MSFSNAPSITGQSEGYRLFRSWVAVQKLTIGVVSEKVWRFLDFGPKEAAPLICIPGAGGTAEVFFKQMISLCPLGYRVISVQFPQYENHEKWCKGFDRFLDKLSIEKVHLFGTALGGYLAQCYSQFKPARVTSMVLNNTFCDTQYFYDNAPCAAMFTLMPEFVLKRILLSNFPQTNLDPDVADSVDFMVEQLETLTQSELAGRLILNCTLGPVRPTAVATPQENITIIDTLDDNALPERLREEVYKFYPDAKQAHLKHGGNFPYLARADEVNMHLQIHLRRHGLPVAPKAPTTPSSSLSSFAKEAPEETYSPDSSPLSPSVSYARFAGRSEDNNNNYDNDNTTTTTTTTTTVPTLSITTNVVSAPVAATSSAKPDPDPVPRSSAEVSASSERSAAREEREAEMFPDTPAESEKPVSFPTEVSESDPRNSEEITGDSADSATTPRAVEEEEEAEQPKGEKKAEERAKKGKKGKKTKAEAKVPAVAAAITATVAQEDENEGL